MSSSASQSFGRREVLAGAVAAGLAMTLKPARAKASANERVNICVIGVRGRGSGVGRNFAGLPDAQVTHICDVNESLLDAYGKSISEVQKSTPNRSKTCDAYWMTRALMQSSLPRLIIGMHWRRSGAARPANMFTSRSLSRTTSLKVVRWWRRLVNTIAWCKSARRVAALNTTSRL